MNEPVHNSQLTTHNFPLVLASSSPRRAEILTSLGIPFTVDPADVAEDVRAGESAGDAASRLATEKAAVISARRPDAWVLAADTLVVLDTEILGKPRDDADAARMLRRISGRAHRVVTAVRLRRGSGPRAQVVAWSGVEIAPLSDSEIAWYVETGVPRDKAGAYAVQGLGARFIEAVDGSYTNVMGLPARAVYRLMKDSGDPALARLVLPCA